MNNLPQLSAIILQIITAALTLIAGLIVTNYSHRLNQIDKPKGHTNLQLIRAATNEIRMYSEKVVSLGEYKDAVHHLQNLLIEFEKLSTMLEGRKTKKETIRPKIILIFATSICAQITEIILGVILNLSVISIILIVLTSLLIGILTFVLIFRIVSPIRKEGIMTEMRYEKIFLEVDQIYNIFYKDGKIRNEIIKSLDKETLKFVRTLYEEIGYAKDLRG